MYLKPDAIYDRLMCQGLLDISYEQVESDSPGEVTVKVILQGRVFYQSVPIDTDEETAVMKAFAIVVANETGNGYPGLPQKYRYKVK